MELLPSSIRYLPRDAYYNGDNVRGRELFASAIEKIAGYDHILITHATSPFVRTDSFQAALDFYLSNLDHYDSLIACRKFDKYAWFEGKTLNYDPYEMIQTNSISPIVVETSGFYFFSASHYLSTGSRVGYRPHFWELSYIESLDIDTESDFKEAERVFGLEQIQALVGHHLGESMSKDIDCRLKVSLEKPKLIVFDFDGVLIDSRRCMELAWSATCKQFSVDIDFELFFACVGMKFEDIMRNLDIDHSQWSAFSDTYFQNTCSNYHEVVVFEGVLEGLCDLKSYGYKVAINTSKRLSNTMELISLLFPDIEFDFVCTPDNILSKRGKPAPDSLLLIASTLGIDPADSVYCGDMNVDQQCAIRAGVKYFHAGWGFGDFAQINTIWFECFKDFSNYLLFL
ncbi:haloacid dehalogenase-like hydrolase family protein [Synechococcus sp. PROS-9-1]|nr:haloacid dehalogenase-like hydrolase family protein [Synechococcus sp. PROS-9-1]